MAVTVEEQQNKGHSKSKIIFIFILFILSLAAFVFQTELTSQSYALGFKEPIILLTVTHGSWWLSWPLQLIIVALMRTVNKVNSKKTNYQPLGSQTELLPPSKFSYYEYYKRAIVKQFHNVYHTSVIIYEFNVNHDERIEGINALIDQHPHISSTPSIRDCVKSFIDTPSIKFILKKTFILAVLLNVAGFTWYGSMALTYASDVTAIYNCSAFTAYVFAIPLLKEKFSWLKTNSVIVAIIGVFIVSYSGSDDDEENEYPYRIWGNLAITLGAIIYGLYEVFYKKYLCIPHHLSRYITPRRQMVFSNFVMALLGTYTVCTLVLGCIIVHLTGIHKFNVFNYNNVGKIWAYNIGSLVANLTFSALFLSLISLTSPVLSSVSSLLSIFLIGIVEWLLFDNKLSALQLFGDILVIIGFVLLTIASWQEISEGEDTDEVEVISNYSFAISTHQ